jgi:hypothetical protein
MRIAKVCVGSLLLVGGIVFGAQETSHAATKSPVRQVRQQERDVKVAAAALLQQKVVATSGQDDVIFGLPEATAFLLKPDLGAVCSFDEKEEKTEMKEEAEKFEKKPQHSPVKILKQDRYGAKHLQRQKGRDKKNFWQ